MCCCVCGIELPKLGSKPNTSGQCRVCYQRNYSRQNKDRKRELAKQLRHKKLKKNCSRCNIDVSVFNRSGFCQDCYDVNFNETHAAQRAAYAKEYLKAPQAKMRRICRDRIREVIDLCKLDIQTDSKFKFIGCTSQELTTYLESKFQPNMTWCNHGKYGWHVDHIRPLASFDLHDIEQFKQACHYSNLQPLWAEDNLKKGDKYE